SGARAIRPRRAPLHDAARCAASTAVGSAMGLEGVHGLIAGLARLIGRALWRQLRYGELVFRSQVAVQGLQEAARLGCKLHAQPEPFLAGRGLRLDAFA